MLLFWLTGGQVGGGGLPPGTPNPLDEVGEPGVWMRGTLTAGGGAGQPPNDGSTSVVTRRRILNVGQGDRLPFASGRLNDNTTGAGVSLAGAVVRFTMTNDQTGVVKVNRALCTIVDGLKGEVEYRWETGDTDTPGMFLAEWEVTIDGRQLTFPNDGTKQLISINPQLA